MFNFRDHTIADKRKCIIFIENAPGILIFYLIHYVLFCLIHVLEFFEEALSLIYELTCKEIPVELWKVLELIYEVRIDLLS